MLAKGARSEHPVAVESVGMLTRFLPARAAGSLDRTTGRLAALTGLFTCTIGIVFYAIYAQFSSVEPTARPFIAITLSVVFLALLLLCGLAAWLLVLADDVRRSAERENALKTAMLMEEIAAHTRTDAACQKAKEAAEAANAAKSRYLAGVSHEIRSPLNAIYGYSQLLERDASIDPQEAGRVIRRSSEHLTNLVDGLLDISRIESGVLKLSRDVVPFPALLEQLAEMFRMQAAAKGIDFRYDHTGRLPEFVRTDEKRLRQVLINLLSNAVKYTQKGHIALQVRYRSQIADIEITDTGCGIRPEDLDRIFEPFERGGMPAARAQPGTGLGLAITRVLTQIMGGDLSVRSTPGEGSRFLLKLMLPEPAQEPPPTARLRKITGYEGPSRTILLVDDDDAQLAVFQQLLRPLGFTVYSASNGADGLALAARCRPDIALLDIQMAGMSGWELAKALRVTHGPGLRIVMISANAHEFAAGGDGASAHHGFVMKPVELEVLLDVLAVQLKLAWITESAGAPAEERAPVLPLRPLPGAAPYLAELRRLGKMGHVRAIGAKLDEMERELPASETLVETLRSRVKAFDLKTYLKMLDAVTHG